MTGPPLKLTMGEAIERLGTGAFQRKLVLAVGINSAADAVEMLLLSFLAIVVQPAFGVGPSEGSLLTSCVFLGALTGTLLLGRMGDKIGRRPTFILAASTCAVSGMLTATAQSYRMMLFFRFFVGFGVGGAVIPYDTLCEFLPDKERGRYLLVLGYFWSIGTLVVPLLAYFALDDQSSWRLLVFLCSFPCVFSTCFSILWVPESPRWLYSHGQPEKALEILRDAAKENGKNPDEIFPLDTTFVDDPNEEQEMHSIGALFKPEWRRLTIIIWFVWAGKSVMYWGTMQLVTLVFSDQDPSDLAPGEGYNFDYFAIMSSSAAEIVGHSITILLVERAGRVWLQSCMYILCGISAVSLCLAAANDPTNRSLLIVQSFLARMFSCGASNLSWLVTAELLPTQIRNTGHSAAYAVARIGGAASPWLVSSSNSFETIAIAYGFVSLWTSGWCSLLPETAGKALGTAHSRSFADDSSPTTSEVL